MVWSYDAETHRVAGIFDTVRAEYGIDIGFLEGTGSYSDNQSYWNVGLPASLSIGGWPYQAPGYHGCGDTVDVVDFANIFKIAEQEPCRPAEARRRDGTADRGLHGHTDRR